MTATFPDTSEVGGSGRSARALFRCQRMGHEGAVRRIWLHDTDEELARAGPDTYLLAAFGYSPSIFADHLVDGLLLGTGEDPSRDVSAVAPSSWGRIKASFR